MIPSDRMPMEQFPYGTVASTTHGAAQHQCLWVVKIPVAKYVCAGLPYRADAEFGIASQRTRSSNQTKHRAWQHKCTFWTLSLAKDSQKPLSSMHAAQDPHTSLLQGARSEHPYLL